MVHKETVGGEEDVHYLDYSDGDPVYICQNSLKCILKWVNFTLTQ